MSLRPRWILPAVEEAEAGFLARCAGIGVPVARILLQRGYRGEKTARGFLAPSLNDLHDPFLMNGMRHAASRLADAVHRREPILLFGDYDVDGIVSVVVLKTVIERAGGMVRCQVPHRLREGYGLSEEAVEQAAADGVKLLVSADTGIRATAAVSRARALGLDIIVTDHHLPESELPPALSVLNPKRLDCEYPDKNLCGAGVVFKFVEALLATLEWPRERSRRMLESVLKLVAIATVADVVPLTGENRVLVRHGLAGLGDVRSVGLRALLDVAGFTKGEQPSAHQVAFRIAPRLNAAGRMADASEAVELLTTADVSRARDIASRLDALNQERQQTEAEIVRRILDQCEEAPVLADQRALVFSGANWHRGVLGIVASRIVEKLYRPTIVLGEDPATGVAQGSGRSIAPFHLLEALESMPELFLKFGGHRQAAGVSLPIDRVAELRERLNRRAAAVLSEEDLTPTLNVDAIVNLRELDDATAGGILALAPFGFGNPTPVLALPDVEVSGEPAVMKEKHLRLSLRQNGRRMTATAWNFAGRLEELRPGVHVDVAVNLEHDDYAAQRGMPGWRSIVRDVRPSARM